MDNDDRDAQRIYHKHYSALISLVVLQDKPNRMKRARSQLHPVLTVRWLFEIFGPL